MASLIWNRNSVVIVTEIRKEYETWHNKLTKRLEEVFVTGFQLFFFPLLSIHLFRFCQSHFNKVGTVLCHSRPQQRSGVNKLRSASNVCRFISCFQHPQLRKKEKDDENKTLKYFLSCLNVLYTVISCSSSVILCDRETPLQKKKIK